MMNNGIPPGGGSRSSTAYIGSYQHALAAEANHALEMRRLSADAQALADQSYADGHEAGYAAGQQATTILANEQLEKQFAYTREHIQEKEAAKAELARQAQVIRALEARINELEAENDRLSRESGVLRTANTELRDLIGSLKGAHQNLQKLFSDLDAKYQVRSKEYAEKVWQYNRAMVFVSTVGGVLEELTRENTPQAQHARDLFAEKYAKEVDRSLKRGHIKMAPEVDPDFARYLPKTRQLIADLLDSAHRNESDGPSLGM